MAEISAEDLKPLVYQYLVKTGLSKAAKAFAKEVGQVRGVRACILCVQSGALTHAHRVLQPTSVLTSGTDDIVEVYKTFCSNRCVYATRPCVVGRAMLEWWS